MTAASLLIDCWESAGRAPDSWRALAMLVPATGGAELRSLAELPVGRCDAWLLELRRRLFGEHIDALARCPSCGVTVEVELDLSDISMAPPDDLPLHVEHEGWALEFRLPDSRDLMAASSAAGTVEAERLLIARCVLRVTRHSRERALEDAPAELINLMDLRMAVADPQADMRLTLQCASCKATWDAGLEAAAFVAAEVTAGAKRLLGEVHRLAAAYGWSEAEILSLAPQRRQAYLELVEGE